MGMLGPTLNFMKRLIPWILVTLMFTVSLRPQSSVTLQSGTPTYVTGEYQVVTGVARANFNLALAGNASMIFGVAVYVNGIRQTPDLQYGRLGATVVLVTPAPVGAQVVIDYAYL